MRINWKRFEIAKAPSANNRREKTLKEVSNRVLLEELGQIHERIWNPKPAITHCPCGHSLEKCLSVTVTSACIFNDSHRYAEFLKTTPEWFVRELAEA